ncbi:NAD(P)/FAD-dependent oxidoreductase [Amycolatopsis sp. FDAARGOS 1241]|uniref:phytoene desaturase family protein n=1 Tax=Amycolatopsis sp. FDAARGOS 1241 TaxID=2778070 RepID=UPI00194E39B4|nr:NAD(P)/FAD-dependent oxidoreductase [Amycolatopsis sp. FDAARGOS 1241]QRP46981.1 NAD(P)/FAD-dependent oxidoreductase [Amycolatopsis sp. FDAARGOS 1241]
MDSTADAVVVGSGPNGLAAAVLLARAGLAVDLHEAAPEPGGGARSARLFDADVVHDVCSAVHPMAVASPFFRGFDLAAHGVELCQPEVAYGHPVDRRRTGLAYADLERTCARLGPDADRWRHLMGPLVEHTRELTDLLLGDLRRPPTPGLAAVLAPRVLALGTGADELLFRGPEAPALLAGVAAHPMGRLPSLVAGGTAVLLGHLAHAGGWPVPRGGTQVLTDALVADFRAHGGRVHVHSRVTDLRQFAKTRAVLLDVGPRGFLDLARPLLPPRYRRALENVRYGPAAAKVDFLVSEPIPWREPELANTATVHIGGTAAQVRVAENTVAAGRRADEPYVLLAQPMAADPSRGLAHKQPIWAYAHVPNGDPLDATEIVRARIERFAPGFGDTVLASRGVPAPELEAYNANYVGGDISGAALTLRQLLARPVVRWNPHTTPLGGVYLCSGATPPGPGVHGMAGLHAAKAALRREFGIRALPTGW